MAIPLADRHCVACRPGTPALTRAEAEAMLSELVGWGIEEASGHLQLAKRYEFKGFLPGVRMVDLIAPIAEAEGHHPDLLLRYGSLQVQLWTHAAGGLTSNDFILAARIDAAISKDY